MQPHEVASSYDAIADRWCSGDFPRDYGIAAHRRAVSFTALRGAALDVGCGSSGRIIELLLEHGFAPEGLDLSSRMLELARRRHPSVPFHRADIRDWAVPRRYDLISAWDSIWHVPLQDQPRVLRKILAALSPGGIVVFTLGGLDGPAEVTDAHMGPPMYHATLGIPRTLEIVARCGCVCRHLEYDQHPEPHVYVIAQRREVSLE